MIARNCLGLALCALLAAGAARGGELPLNKWARLEKAEIGMRTGAPLVWSPASRRFMVLGGRLAWNARGDQPYQDLALDMKECKWENWYPTGKSFGPTFGPCKPPKFKKYYGNLFADVEGNNRVNQNAHMSRFTYGLYSWNPDMKKFYFHGGGWRGAGHTWTYAPAERKWAGVETAAHPGKEGVGPLLWSSMCYDSSQKKFVLFGGGNVMTERGDPGTWLFDPATKQWTHLKLGKQPSPRANSRLAYDPVAKKVVLFGGDELDRLVADTWTFDGKGWEEMKPPLSPSPRAGHAMLWLPKARKMLLLGGYTYDSGGGYHGQYYKSQPLDAWTYDAKANSWALVKRFEDTAKSRLNCHNSFLNAAASDEDVVAVLAGRKGLWLCRLDASRVDAAGTARHGAKPGAVTLREKFYDPKWYTEGVPAANPAQVAAGYQALPTNKWVRRNPPRIPRPNMDWGSAVYLPKLDVIARYSGGHCAYSGTAPHVYDPKTDRWSIPFAPELPMDHCNSDAGVPGEWSFKGRPWMPGHTWKATGADKAGGRLVYIHHKYTWFFDPVKKEWQRSSATHPRHDVRVTTLCTTPKGTVAYAYKERGNNSMVFYLVDSATGEWKLMPLKGKLPRAGIDTNGLAYDSKRDRLLLFAPREKGHAGDVMSYDMKTGEAKWMNAAGREKAATRLRETVYLPECDMVMGGGRVKGPDGKLVWLFYDCAQNKWRYCDFPGDDPISYRGKKVASSVSVGLMYDSKRKLIWMVGQNSDLTVLKFDPKTAGLKDLR